MVRAPEFVQLPPDMDALPMLVALAPMSPDVLVTVPPLIVRVPLPDSPTVSEPEFVQLPAEIVALPLLP
jgi:hypothetical protein